MKLEDQVLSLEQVRELQELGFDVKKHASMCWITYTSDEEPYEKEYSLSILDEFCYESASLEPIPTMSIGDIIEVLPMEIKIKEDWFSFRMSKISIEYFNAVLYKFPYKKIIDNNIINNLFDCLVWCIKEKYIKL